MVKRNGGTSKEDICQNQFTAYVVLAVKRKRQAYIKKKVRDKENQAKREEEQSNFGAEENTVWDRLEVQNEELVAAVQQLKPKARFIVTGYVLKGKTFKELAQETKLTERARTLLSAIQTSAAVTCGQRWKQICIRGVVWPIQKSFAEILCDKWNI